MDFKVALLQLLPGKTQEENLRKGIEACIMAKEKEADVALFPEMWNNGYALSSDTKALEKMASVKTVISFRVSGNWPLNWRWRSASLSLKRTIRSR